MNRNLLLLSCAILVLFGVNSCEKNSVENDDYFAMILTAQKSAGNTIYFVSDDSDETYVLEDGSELSDSIVGKRCYVECAYLTPAKEFTYTMVDPFVHLVCEANLAIVASNAELAKCANVACTPILAWNSGKYLNVVYDYYGNGNITHTFDMIQNLGGENPNDSTQLLYISHDANGDTGSGLLSEIYSYDISTLKTSYSKNFTLKIRYKTNDDVEAYLEIPVKVK